MATTETSEQESRYTIEQLTDSYDAFGTSRAIVTCALRLSGKKLLSFTEAQQMINVFKNQEVK